MRHNVHRLTRVESQHCKTPDREELPILASQKRGAADPREPEAREDLPILASQKQRAQ
jgi:hypothetical protein